MKTHRRKRAVLKLLGLILVLGLFTGCSLLFFTGGEVPDHTLSSEPLELRSGIELTNLRVDLYRNSETSQTTDQNGNANTETTEEEYQPVGFYLCRGIFYDINRNLSLVIPDLFGLTSNDDYNIREIKYGFFSTSEYSVTKKGNKINEADEKMIFPIRRNITLLDDSIVIDGGTVFPDETSMIR